MSNLLLDPCPKMYFKLLTTTTTTNTVSSVYLINNAWKTWIMFRDQVYLYEEF